MRGPATLMLCAVIGLFAVGCGGDKKGDKAQFQKDAKGQLDKLDSRLKDLEKKAGDAGMLEVGKKASVTAAKTGVSAAREAVKKLENVSDEDFESAKTSIQKALDAAQAAVKDAEKKFE